MVDIYFNHFNSLAHRNSFTLVKVRQFVVGLEGTHWWGLLLFYGFFFGVEDMLMVSANLLLMVVCVFFLVAASILSKTLGVGWLVVDSVHGRGCWLLAGLNFLFYLLT